MENIPIFKLELSDYPMVEDAPATKNPPRHMSMKQCAALLHNYQSSLHFSTPRDNVAYPRITSGLNPHYDGLMSVAVGYGSTQPRRLISGVASLSEIFENGSFVTPPYSHGRNWLSVLPALAPFSHLILYSEDKDDAELLQIASAVAEAQYRLFVTGKSSRLYRTFILEDFAVENFEAEYPDLVVYALHTDDNKKYQHRIMADHETDQGFLVKALSAEILPGIWLGTLHSFQEEHKLSKHSLYVQCVSRAENVTNFPDGAPQPVWLPKNIETIESMLQFLVDTVTSVMLLRVDESDLGTPKFTEWMTALSLFLSTRAANGEHTLIFCKTGHITAPSIALATILYSISRGTTEDLNSNDSIPLFGRALVQLQKARPCHLAKPLFGNIARLLSMHLTGRPDTYFSESISGAGFAGGLPSFIIPNLFLGNVEHFRDANVLNALGIKTIVSICYCQKSDMAHINHVRIEDVMDDSESSLYHSFEGVTKIMHECLEGGGGGVLVHCQAGVSRSATIVIAYLMRYKNMTLRDAFLYVRHRRLTVFVQPNVQFMYDLLEYELALRGKRSVAWLDLMKELHILNTVARAKDLLV